METDLIRTSGPYDFEVDTANAVPAAVAASVLTAWRARTRARVLRRGIAGNRGTLSRTCRCRHSSRQMSASWKCARMIAGGYVLVVAVSLSPSSETVTFTGPAGAVARLNFRP